MKVKSAKGEVGFLLYSPFTEKYVFRIYDPEDKSKHTDYDLCACDIGVQIVDETLELYQGEDRNKLDYSRKVLGK